MSVEKLINDWKKSIFKPVYWLEGEESFYIDKAMNYAEHHILSVAEVDFNLTIFYGKDAQWAEVLNTCKRYPMFAERQIVLLKEAQHMKDIEKLQSYIEQPCLSTLFIISYKEKKIDGRSKFAKVLKQYGEVLTTKKLYDNQLPTWLSAHVRHKGFEITQKAVALLVEHIGNNLSRLNNEIDKILINISHPKKIDVDDVEQYVGISKEFNIFELQHAIGKKDMNKTIRIIQYFEANPKAAPIQMVLPNLYNFFSKVHMVLGSSTTDQSRLAKTLGVHEFFIRDYLYAAQQYTYKGIEKALLLLQDYNLRSLGINDAGTTDAALLKELALKILIN